MDSAVQLLVSLEKYVIEDIAYSDYSQLYITTEVPFEYVGTLTLSSVIKSLGSGLVTKGRAKRKLNVTTFFNSSTKKVRLLIFLNL